MDPSCPDCVDLRFGDCGPHMGHMDLIEPAHGLAWAGPWDVYACGPYGMGPKNQPVGPAYGSTRMGAWVSLHGTGPRAQLFFHTRFCYCNAWEW